MKGIVLAILHDADYRAAHVTAAFDLLRESQAKAHAEGRRAGLEEAAKVCDAEEDSCREACRDAEPDEVGSEFINELRGGQAAVGSCAMKIRALAEKEGAGT